MLMLKAVSDVSGSLQEGKASVEFSIGRGYFCLPKGNLAARVVSRSGDGRERIDPSFVEQVKMRMQELVRENLPIMKRAYPTDEAIELFDSQ